MKTKSLLAFLTLVVALGSTSPLFAQAPKIEFPSPSPACTIKQRVGLTDIEITYSRPSAKGRQIFGKVVPFGTVWRTGANNATKITFSTPVKLNGTDIPAGTYSLFTIPGETEWTIIINKTVDKSGTQYDEKADLVRFTTKPANLSTTIETFTIEFNRLRDESAALMLVWENTAVPIQLELDFTSKLQAQIETAMAAEGGNKPYYQAAMFYYDHNLDLAQASKWVDAAIAQRDAYYMVHLKAKILAKRGDKEAAIAAAKHSSELAVAAKDTAYVKLNDDLIASLK
jgi:hypothetical protein